MLKKYLITAATIILPLITQEILAEAPKEIAIQAEKEDKAETYELAAKSRRKAAEIQSEHASKLLSQASELKGNYEQDENKRIKRFCNAGELEITAGDMQVAASKNYQAAQSNLIHTINNYKKPSKDKIEKIEKQITIKIFYSKEYLKKAIETYLIAAESFSWPNGENPVREAFANEKAAAVLEKIAQEKP